MQVMIALGYESGSSSALARAIRTLKALTGAFWAFNWGQKCFLSGRSQLLGSEVPFQLEDFKQHYTLKASPEDTIKMMSIL